MNQKGFANIALIILVVVLAGALGYVALVRKPSLVEQPISNNPQNTQLTPSPRTNTNSSQPSTSASNLRTYRNDKYGFEVKYPSNFVFRDSQSTPDSWALTKLREGRVIKPVDCGGFLKQSDEIRFSWSVFDRQNPEYAGVNVVQAIENRYNSFKYVPISIGNKSLKVQRSIPGMCENGDEFIWIEPSGRWVVLFNINPSNTTLVDEYKEIIASFKIF